MTIKDFKYSYNRFHKIYRVEIKENGKWRRNIYEKATLETALEHSIPSDIRNYPYKPYFIYRIKWGFMFFKKWIIQTDPKIKSIAQSGTLLIIGYMIRIIPKLLPQDNNQDITKLLLDKEQIIQTQRTLLDSLEEEIKQMEVTIMEFELDQKEQPTVAGSPNL